MGCLFNPHKSLKLKDLTSNQLHALGAQRISNVMTMFLPVDAGGSSGGLALVWPPAYTKNKIPVELKCMYGQIIIN